MIQTTDGGAFFCGYKGESSLDGDFGTRIMPLLYGESIPMYFIEISFYNHLYAYIQIFYMLFLLYNIYVYKKN
jgi:hypothetical protein